MLPAGAAATFYWNPGIPASSWYNVVNQNSGSCVDARSYGTANGTAVQRWAWPAQVWGVTNVGT